MLTIGFIGSYELIGVTSFCRFWALGETAYKAFEHFFRYSSWSLTALIFNWSTFLVAQGVAFKVQNRIVLAGDHTYFPKDGRRIPGVVALHQHSETQSKPSYFRGHCWGAVCMMTGSLSNPFGTPLDLAIHQGFAHIRQNENTKENSDTLGSRIVKMALSFAVRHDLPCVLTLDAYFPCASVFMLADSIWSIELKQPLITLIIRAKKNCVAYHKAEIAKKPKRGRPPKYGEKVKLTDLFDLPHLFQKAECRIYGKMEKVSFMAVNLLWKPTGSLVRFVLAVTSRGPIVLMCSDLGQDPILALQLYCLRTRIEVMFDVMKNLIGAFNCHFWSKSLPKHSRKPKKNKDLKKPAKDRVSSVKHCWEAYEKFVMIGAIATGLLQLLSLKFTDVIWNNFDAYLRTRSRVLPSERTVKHVASRLLFSNFLNSKPTGIMRKIKEQFHGADFAVTSNSLPPKPDQFEDQS